MNNTLKIHPSAFIADGAIIVGRVTINANASIWYNCVLRCDMGNTEIVIGENTNVQDGTVIHVDYDKSALVGNNVTIGHNCTIHGCTIEDNCLIGMGAVILSGATIKCGAVVAAGSVVKENAIIEPDTLVAGAPSRPIKKINQNAKDRIHANLENYVLLGKEHKNGGYDKYES